MLGTSEGTFCPLSKHWCKSPQTEFFGPECERFLYKVKLRTRYASSFDRGDQRRGTRRTGATSLIWSNRCPFCEDCPGRALFNQSRNRPGTFCFLRGDPPAAVAPVQRSRGLPSMIRSHPGRYRASHRDSTRPPRSHDRGKACYCIQIN